MTLHESRQTGSRVAIPRWHVRKVIDMPGLTRIDLEGDTAELTFTTAPGCEPADTELVVREVARMGALPGSWGPTYA